MTFVNKVRVKTDIEKIDIRTAVIEAVDECIAENVLSEFFRNHREEVIAVSIYEYDEEGHLEIVKEEGRQLGIAEGRQLGLAEGLNKGINAFIKLCKDMNLSYDDTVNKLIAINIMSTCCHTRFYSGNINLWVNCQHKYTFYKISLFFCFS